MNHRVELLVATMHQTDFSKIEEMHIHSDVIFANQADRADYAETEIDGCRVRMYTTPDRGVGRNRNLALVHSTAELVIFADDDMIYSDGYADAVCKAFDEVPQADVLVFETDFSRNGEIYNRNEHPLAKLPYRKSWKYGTYAFAARRASLEKANIWFHMQFGGGCPHSSGEDSLFINDCMTRGLNVYTHPYLLGCCKKDESTWFRGYTEKYFIDKGCWLSLAMPRACRLAVPLLAVKWRKLNPDFGVWKAMRLMWQGISEFRGKR